MGTIVSLCWRILSRFPFSKEKPSLTQKEQQESYSKLTDVLRNGSRCCADVKCTSLARTAKELLSKMEQIQTQLHNEVVLWKLRYIRGICTTESRQNFYELLGKFNSSHEMLDAIIENEKKYIEALEPEQKGDYEGHKSETIDVEPSVVLIEKSGTVKNALRRRIKFFTKVHERNVKLLFLVVNEVAECRSMVDTSCINGQELSDSFASEITETGRFLSVLEESNDEELIESSLKRLGSNRPGCSSHRIGQT
ncbi:uncharacterized protein LOC111333072 [Stylophora pistillata]|uniref:uncharacterized protein LOC111333072 n=1 Tax=Stylophora pistillata TaxID=50429 RepID=UPI000C041AA0|nr:uncharacterized protein LOC111333072 [Stylophora pistillata]